MKTRLLLAASLLAVWVTQCHAGTITVNFGPVSSTPTDPRVFLETETPSTGTVSYQQGAGTAIFSTTLNSSVGESQAVRLRTNFFLAGDFSVQVDFDRSIVPGPDGGFSSTTGMAVDRAGGGSVNVFAAGTSSIFGGAIYDGLYDYPSVADSSQLITFRLRRVGNTIYRDYDTGGGFQSFSPLTGDKYLAPLQPILFLYNEHS